MSRIGKVPVVVPRDVKVKIENSHAVVEGPKGKLSLSIPLGIALEEKEGKIFVKRLSDAKQNLANHGTVKRNLENVMVGVTQGYKKTLEIQGVGFKAQIQGQKLTLNVGLSHPVEFTVPESVKVKTPKPTELEIEGIDKALVGEVAADIRSLKPPEPYKGKGIRYTG